MRRLEVFVAISECGGFRSAAERLGMAPPSVSAHVQALEVEVGGDLFERRSGRGVRLTDIGQTFLRHARLLLAEADDMASDMRRVKLETDRRVIFACQRSLSDFLPAVLADFADQRREIELITRVGRHEEVIEMIETGAANLGLYLGNLDIPGLKSVIVGQQELAIVTAPGHTLAKRRLIDAAELEHHNFVGPPEGSYFNEAMLQLLAEIGAKNISIVSRATEFEFLRALAIAGVGLYCCLRKRVAPDIDRGALVMLPIDAPPLMMDVRQVFSGRRPVSPSVALFAEFLRQHPTELGATRRPPEPSATARMPTMPIE